MVSNGLPIFQSSNFCYGVFFMWLFQALFFYYFNNIKFIDEETIFSTKKLGDDSVRTPITAIIMGMYLFITNIVLLNLLITIFK